MFQSAPMTLETQHYVMCPEWDGTMKATAVYAVSAEAAVEQTRSLFKEDPKYQNADIHLATGEELPWNHPESSAFMVSKKGDATPTLYFGMEEETRQTYDFLFQGAPYELRAATPEEKERSIRVRQLEEDERDEEDFNYGFNVLYHEMRDREEGL
jgi:hypothetical protein